MTFLTSDGNVYALSPPWNSPHPNSKAGEINFPEPISEISAGSYHVVALSEMGRVYTFHHTDAEVQRVTFSFQTIDYYPGFLRPDEFGKVGGDIGLVRKVVGGGKRSAALISGVGIVIWNSYNQGTGSRQAATYQAGEHIISGTNYLENPPRDLPAETLNELQRHRDIGQVLDFAMEEDYLLFVTTRGKVYAVMGLDNTREPIRPPFQLHKFSSSEGNSITRVTCGFRDFAVFNKDGLVHMGVKDMVYDAASGKKEPQPPENPDFTGHKVVDIAFGKFHGLALTDKGEVLAWGCQYDVRCCLGLGDNAALLRCGATPIRRGLVKLVNPAVVPFGNPIHGIGDFHSPPIF